MSNLMYYEAILSLCLNFDRPNLLELFQRQDDFNTLQKLEEFVKNLEEKGLLQHDNSLRYSTTRRGESFLYFYHCARDVAFGDHPEAERLIV